MIFNEGKKDEAQSEMPFHSGPYCRAFRPVLVKKGGDAYLTVRHGDASKEFNLSANQQIVLLLGVSDYYREEEIAYSFDEKRDGSLYENEEDFANFRPLFTGKNSFYRSSSPFDDAYGRSGAVLSCMEKFKVKTIIDLADSKNELQRIIDASDDGTKSIIKARSVFALGSDSGLYSDEFEQSVVFAIRAILASRAPYLIHCRAGKRRSGFISAILQALYGMDVDDIMEDYMLSYKNNNGVTFASNPRRYSFLKSDTIEKILVHINGADFGDLRKSTEEYLRRIGLSRVEILALEQMIRQ